MSSKYKRLKAMLLAGTISLTSLGLSGCGSKVKSQDSSSVTIISDSQEIGEEKEFGIGEHIISVIIETNICKNNHQFEYHEGYEPVGLSILSLDGNSYYGGVILYKNVVPVKCVCDIDGYTNFGTPILDEQIKTLK